MDSKEFCCEGNLFADLESLSLSADITPRQHKISSDDFVMARSPMGFDYLNIYQPLMLSLPSNDDFKSWLPSLSTRLPNRYLVTKVIQYSNDPDSSIIRYLWDIAKPFVWYRNNSTASEERSDNELRAETEGTKVTRVYDVDEVEL